MKKLSFSDRENLFWQLLRNLAIIIAGFYIVFSVNRLVFYYLFISGGLPEVSLWEKIYGFILGIRFDSATIVYGVSPVILLLYIGLFIPFQWYYKVWNFFSWGWLTIISTIILVIFVVDINYFEFYRDHLNYLVFMLFEDDAKAVFNTIIKNYPVIKSLLFIIMMIGAIGYGTGKVLKRRFSSRISIKPLYLRIFLILATVVLIAVMGRASFGLFPIRLMDAAYSSHAILNKLAPNPVITLEKAIGKRVSGKDLIPFWQRSEFQNDIVAAISMTDEYLSLSNKLPADAIESKVPELIDPLIRRVSNDNRAGEEYPHVIIAAMEGFGAWVLDYEKADFQISGGLNNWFDKGLYFDHFISSGHRSLNSLVSIMLSLPVIPYALPLSQSQYSIIPFESSMGHAFSSMGYETRFVYGGSVSWQRLNDFLPHQGFQYIHGDGDYDNSLPRTDWGVFDEEVMEFVTRLLKTAEKPQLIVIMTTTNHPPFQLPDNYDPLPLKVAPELQRLITADKKLTADRFKVYQYANRVMADFLDSLTSNEYGQNTVVALTGDHNFGSVRPYANRDLLDYLSVPFYIYLPEKFSIKPRRIHTFGSHVDIAPTIYNLVFPGLEYFSFGNNLLEDNPRSFALNEDGTLFMNDGVLKFDFQTDQIKMFAWTDQERFHLSESIDSEIGQQKLSFLKAYLSSASYYMDIKWKQYLEKY